MRLLLHIRVVFLSALLVGGVGGTAIVSLVMPRPVYAYDIVLDPWNLVKNTTTAIENIAQTIHMIEDYIMQIKHLENMIKNTLAPVAYLMDQVDSLIDDIIDLADTVREITDTFGNFDNYLNKFKDVNYYRDSPCFKKGGCTPEEWTLMKEIKATGSEARMKANKIVAKILKEQQEQIDKDAERLKRMQDKVEGSDGRMKALQHANELAAMENQQMLQMRMVLQTSLNAENMERQDAANEEAIEEVAAQAYFRTEFEKTTHGSGYKGGW